MCRLFALRDGGATAPGAAAEARRRPPERCSGQVTQKTMASIYHAFDAPFAPVESKVETVRSATKCCFAFDL